MSLLSHIWMASAYSAKHEEEHLEHLRIIFQRFKEAGLKLKRSKCDFMKTQIHYLGHLISSNGIQPLPEKLGSIKNMPALWSAKEVKQYPRFSWEVSSKFVPQFSDLFKTSHQAHTEGYTI